MKYLILISLVFLSACDDSSYKEELTTVFKLNNKTNYSVSLSFYYQGTSSVTIAKGKTIDFGLSTKDISTNFTLKSDSLELKFEDGKKITYKRFECSKRNILCSEYYQCEKNPNDRNNSHCLFEIDQAVYDLAK
ncbi:MAG: hypothetical protein WBO36_02280 [Saprospiraceae bacterium]